MPLRYQVSLFTLLAGIYLLFAPGKPWVEADYQRLMAQQLVRHGALSSPELDVEPRLQYARIQGANGRWYDYHGVANIFAQAPAVALGQMLSRAGGEQLLVFLCSLTGLVWASGTCLVFLHLLLLLGRPRGVAIVMAAGLGLLTLFFPYAVTNYEANVNALAILSGLYFLLRFEKEGRERNLGWAGLCAGIALHTRDFGLFFVGLACLYVAWRSLRRRRWQVSAAFAATFGPCLLLWGYYNWLRTGHPLMTPIVAGMMQQKYQAAAPVGNELEGLGGLLLSPGGSIFAYSPVLLLSALGLRDFTRTARLAAGLVFSLLTLWFVALAKVPEWFGFFCWGPRYTLEMTPLLLLPAAWGPLWRKASPYWLRGSAALLAAWSFLIQLSGVLGSWFARMALLLDRGRDHLIGSAAQSQWWDSLQMVAANFHHLFFGQWSRWPAPPIAPELSPASAYTARTIEAWWNRLLFEGMAPWKVALIVFALLSIITLSARELGRACTGARSAGAPRPS